MPPPSVRRVASATGRENIEKLRLLLELGFVPLDLQKEAQERAAKRARAETNVTKAGPWWTEWGTLLDRKIAVKESRLDGGSGQKGLFAGVRFATGQVITLYGGRLLTLQEAHTNSDRLVRLPFSGNAVYLVDGLHGTDDQLDTAGLYMPAPGTESMGAGAIARDSSRVPGAKANAKLVFKPLGRDMAAELLPKVPMLVALRPIEEDEEIVFDFSKERWYSRDLLPAFLQSASVVLRLGELVNKLDKRAVFGALQRILESGKPIQIAYLQGATPLQTPEGFKLLCTLLTRCPV